MCCDVLRTACTIIRSLQPLSLANETQIPPLGLKALKDISGFLSRISLPTSGADPAGELNVIDLLRVLLFSLFSYKFCITNLQNRFVS